MTAPFFPRTAAPAPTNIGSTPATPAARAPSGSPACPPACPPVATGVQSPCPRRINPWRMFIGSMVPNWLQCRPEVSPGAKLAYGRLAQYAGKDGQCFPKQKTLAVELGVTERMTNEYIRQLAQFELIQIDRPGLGLSNRYYFLDHPWIHDGQPEAPSSPGQERQASSVPVRKDSSGNEQQEPSAPTNKENHLKENQIKRSQGPHSPPSGERGIAISSLLSHQAEEIYLVYPKKVGKPAGLRAIHRAISRHTFEIVKERTRLYAQTYNGPADYIPNPSTFFNQDRFMDDAATWHRAAQPGRNGAFVPQRKFDSANYNQPV